jgi:excisionase family DNA binding protein
MVALLQEFYTVKELAALLGMNPRTIQRLAQRGDLKAHRFGGGKRPALRFRRDDIEAFLKKSKG